ncbi:MAG: hypothetical protein AAF619_03975 [Pseudomonadota bacterium]
MTKAVLAQLRGEIARIEDQTLTLEDSAARPVIDLGHPTLNAPFQPRGGPDRGALHEMHGAVNLAPHRSAPTVNAFALAFALQRVGDRPVVWVADRLTRREAGLLYGPGLSAFGVEPSRVLIVEAKDAREVLWTMEEGLSSDGLHAIIGSVWGDPTAVDMTATRRLHLAAQAKHTPALLLRHGAALGTSAAQTRWRIASHPGAPPAIGQRHRAAFTLSRPRWSVALERNRLGQTGHWIVEWDAHGRAFVDPARTAREHAETAHPGSVVSALPGRASAPGRRGDGSKIAAFRGGRLQRAS